MRALILSLALAAGAFAGSAALAQDQTFDLKFSSWVPPSHGMHPAIKAWGESMAKASNGTLKLGLFPSQQLGKAEDHYDMARDGIAEFTYVSMGYQPGRLPLGESGSLPFLYSTGGNGSKAFDAFYRKYQQAEMKDVKFCFAFIHDPATIYSKVPIKRPEDVKGIKMRSANTQTSELVTDLGGINVRVAAPEARAALESGVAEAIMFPWKSILLFGIDKAVNHAIDFNLYTTTFAILMHQGTYDKMSAPQKKVIDEHCSNEWAFQVGKTWGDYEAAGRAELQGKRGFVTYKPTPDDIKAWRDAGKGVHTRWENQVKAKGLDPAKVLADLQDEIKKTDPWLGL